MLGRGRIGNKKGYYGSPIVALEIALPGYYIHQPLILSVLA